MCTIRQEFLTSKAASLGEKTNKAVHDFDPSSYNNHGTDDEDASDNDGNDREEESSHKMLFIKSKYNVEIPNETTNTQTVFNLISRVKAWRRFEISQS